MGRFRNLIHTTVIPTKRTKYENSIGVSESPSTSSTDVNKSLHHSALIMPHLYQGLPPTSHPNNLDTEIGAKGSKLGLLLPNPAPEVLPTTEDIQPIPKPYTPNISASSTSEESLDEGPKKKKYAKEAWPGRKPLLSGF